MAKTLPEKDVTELWEDADRAFQEMHDLPARLLEHAREDRGVDPDPVMQAYQGFLRKFAVMLRSMRSA